MVRRARGASFMGGVSVFPGGRVDDADTDEALLGRCVGLSEAEAAERLGVTGGALGYYVAALRELFEESGVLLALEEDGRPLVLGGERAERIAEQRRAVNRGELSFLELLAAERLLLDLGGLRHHAHWITPEVEPKRFDTYFFVGAAPVGQEPLHDEGETTAAGCCAPPRPSGSTARVRSRSCCRPSGTCATSSASSASTISWPTRRCSRTSRSSCPG